MGWVFFITKTTTTTTTTTIIIIIIIVVVVIKWVLIKKGVVYYKIGPNSRSMTLGYLSKGKHLILICLVSKCFVI